MKFRNRKTGGIWEIIRDKDGWVSDDGVIAFLAIPDGQSMGMQIFKYPSISALNEDWEDFTSSSYEEFVKNTLRRYMWEVYHDLDLIAEARNHDGRKYRNDSAEVIGRLYAVQDIARELGVVIEPVSDFFPDEDTNNGYREDLHNDSFYSYGFGWKEEMYGYNKKDKTSKKK